MRSIYNSRQHAEYCHLYHQTGPPDFGMTAQELDLKAELSVGVQKKIGEAKKLVVRLNLQLFVGCLELLVHDRMV